MHATRLTQLNEFEADLLGVALASPAFLLSAVDLDATQAPLSVSGLSSAATSSASGSACFLSQAGQ